MARNYDHQRRDKPSVPGPGSAMLFGSGKSAQGNLRFAEVTGVKIYTVSNCDEIAGEFPKHNFGTSGDTALSKTGSALSRDRNSLLVPLNIRSSHTGGTGSSDKVRCNQSLSFPGPELKEGQKGSMRISARQNYDDSQRTTLGQNSFAVDSQMTVAEQPSSYGSQNCSYNDSQASIPTDEAVPSQHRLMSNHPPSQTSNPAIRTFNRYDQPSVSRAQTPISGGGSRSLLQEHRPPKGPTWNSNLIKRAASPVVSMLTQYVQILFTKIISLNLLIN
jgi:hypothetical protein